MNCRVSGRIAGTNLFPTRPCRRHDQVQRSSLATEPSRTTRDLCTVWSLLRADIIRSSIITSAHGQCLQTLNFKQSAADADMGPRTAMYVIYQLFQRFSFHSCGASCANQGLSMIGSEQQYHFRDDECFVKLKQVESRTRHIVIQYIIQAQEFRSASGCGEMSVVELSRHYFVTSHMQHCFFAARGDLGQKARFRDARVPCKFCCRFSLKGSWSQLPACVSRAQSAFNQTAAGLPACRQSGMVGTSELKRRSSTFSSSCKKLDVIATNGIGAKIP